MLGANTTSGNLAQFSGNQAHTIFVVRELSQTSGTAEFDLYIGNTINTNEAIHVFKSPAGQAANGFYNKANYYTPIIGTTAVYTSDYDGDEGTTDRIRSWTNGDVSNNLFGGGHEATNLLNLPSNPSLSIGAKYNGSTSTRADLAEIIIYDRKLSDQERQAVEAYLAQKWLDEPL